MASIEMFDYAGYTIIIVSRYDVVIIFLGSNKIIRRLRESFRRRNDGSKEDATLLEIFLQVFPVSIIVVTEQ